MRSGGAMLLAGAILFCITVGLELWVGWTTGGERPLPELAASLLDLWGTLRWIWATQAVAVFLFASSALVLLRSRHLQGRWTAAAPLWSMTAIGSLLALVAYCLTLGSYPPALAVFEQDPDLFATVSGGIRLLYFPGLLLAWLGYLPLLIREGVAKDGPVPRSWLVVIAVVAAAAILAGSFEWLEPSTAGAVAFLMPAVLGAAIWKDGRRLGRGAPRG